MQPPDTLPNTRGRRSASRGIAAAAALVGVALFIAGCGGSSSPGVASIGGSKSTDGQSAAASSGGGVVGGGGSTAPSVGLGHGAQSGFAIAGGNRQDALKFSACMRANGVPTFPDPSSTGVIQGTGIDPSSAAFQSAQQKCARYTPNGGQPPSPAQQAQAQAQALKFSACMRSHGVTNFPDPQFSSGGGIRIKIQPGPGGSGLDPSSPIFQAAQKACGSLLPGLKAGAPSALAGGSGG